MAIQTIITQLAAIEGNISGIRKAYDQVPDGIAALPCVVNFIDGGEISHGGDGTGDTPFGQRDIFHNVKAVVYVMKADIKAAENTARPFIKLFTDAIDGHYGLNSTCIKTTVRGYQYGEHVFQGVAYLGIEFDLGIWERESVTFAA